MVKLIPLANTRRDPRRRSSAGISVEARRGKVMLEGKELKRPVVLQDAAFQRTMGRIRDYVTAGLLTVEKLPGTDENMWERWSAPEASPVLTVNIETEAKVETKAVDAPAPAVEEKSAEPAVVDDTPAVADGVTVAAPPVEAETVTEVEETAVALAVSDAPVDEVPEVTTPAPASDVNSKQVARPVRKAIMPRVRPVSAPEG